MFDPLKKLESGDYSFLFDLTPMDTAFLIANICKSPYYDKIVNTLLNSPYDHITLKVIYDNSNYSKETINILEKKNIKLQIDQLYGFINAHPNNYEYIINNLDEYLKYNPEDVLRIIINYMMRHNKDLTILKKLTNMHHRAIFIKIILNNYPNVFYKTFPNFLDYLYGYTYEEYEQLDILIPMMDINDIEEIAFLILDKLNDKYLFNKIKDFILLNYKSNNLALLMLKRNTPFINNELRTNSDILFITSLTPIKLLRDGKFSKLISSSSKEQFESKNSLYLNNNSHNIENIFSNNLEKDLYEWMDICIKHSKSKEIKKIGSGVSAEVYKIGDYVIKLIKQKMSKAKILCPENYLVLPTLYERYITNENGDIIAGIEVQRYLETPNLETIGRLEHLFRKSFKQKGYVLNDLLVRDGNPTVGLLPSYKEANCRNPENLPEWFKEIPLVLMDRDLVYPVPKKRI